jgi:Tfp pilus tip-associated adhesin PilY1
MLFTNLDESHGFQLINFTAEAALTLQSLINSDSANAAAALINAARGRLSTSPADPAGSDDRSLRLGAISRSTPALVGGSPFDPAAAARDQVLYAGAEDGFLHAFLAGRRETVGGGYDHLAAGSGEELWGYLPGSLLPGLNFQPFDDVLEFAAVHVDGSPLVTDLFIDCNGDGHREWRTVLVATASIQTTNQGVVFALDVTDPHVPRLLWETTLPGSGLGRSRGAAIGRFGAEGDSSVRVFITAGTIGRIAGDGSPAPLVGSYGAMACALNLDDGRLLWQFVAPYTNEAINLAEPPTAPVLMLAADSGGIDGVLFGDLAGQLWALDPHSGAAFGGRPLWQSSAGAAEPIGGALAVHNRLALFGTGGVAHADTRRDYSVYALEILPEGGRLLWTLPLARGEKLWGAPGLDRFGRAYLGLGSEADDSGHLLVLGADGTPAGNTVLGGIPSGGVTLISGAVITVTRSGRVELIGDFGQETSRDVAPSGRVRVFSWRQR